MAKYKIIFDGEEQDEVFNTAKAQTSLVIVYLFC